MNAEPRSVVYGRVLVVDDDPGRYEAMFGVADAMGLVLLVTDHPEAVRLYLDPGHQGGPPLRGVCLDYDMGHRDGAEIATTYLTHLGAIRVAITSANLAGAVRIQQVLDDAGVDNRHFEPPERARGEPADRTQDELWASQVLTWLLRGTRT